MRSTQRNRRFIALLTFGFVASSVLLVAPANGGPISDMLARHRQSKQMKLPPMDPPFSKKPIKDLNAKTASFSTRLKKRFSFGKDGSSFQDPNVNKTSR